MPVMWTDCLGVRVQELDEQHRGLIQEVNALSRPSGADTLGPFDRLLCRIDDHFRSEERHFAQLDYPSAVAHCQEHQALLVRLRWLRTALAEGRVELTATVLSRLEEWLVGHIFLCDRQYAVLSGRDAVSGLSEPRYKESAASLGIGRHPLGPAG